MEKPIINEILEALFTAYQEGGGTRIIDLGRIIREHGEDPHQVGKYLVAQGWVKNHMYQPTTFVAAISLDGIQKIHPEYIDDMAMSMLKAMNENINAYHSIMQTLEFEPKDFQIAHDVAFYMRDMGWAEVIAQHNDVGMKITFQGRTELQ